MQLVNLHPAAGFRRHSHERRSSAGRRRPAFPHFGSSLLMAKVLDWTALHILGTSSTAPETSVVAGFFTLLPLMSVTKRLVEHHTTDALLKKVEEIEQRKAVP